MISSLKSLAWVAPLTILIWVYAEREQIAVVQSQTIPINVKSADPSLIVTIAPDDQNIVAEISGPRVAVDRVTDQLKMIPKSEQGVVIEIPNSYGPGSFPIPSSAIATADLFKKAGVTISKPSPQNIHVQIDRIVERELDVKMPADVQNLVGTPAFEPRKVRVSGPETVLKAAEDKGQLAVYGDFKAFRELSTPGKHMLENVPLVLAINDKNATISPTTAKVALEVRQVDVEFQKDALPIYVTYTPGFDAKYRAVYFPSLPNVTLYGPSEKIEAMQKSSAEFQPKARFEVGPKDLPAGPTRTAKLLFDPPDGVRISDKDKERTVEFHLVPQGTPE